MADQVLRTAPVADPDDLYQLLVEAHRDLAVEQSQLVNSKLTLLLANHIGDPAVIALAIAAAREGIAPSTPEPTDSAGRR
jgi:Protein of unknown function (DUF2783)